MHVGSLGTLLTKLNNLMWLADERELTIEESKEGISQLSQQRNENRDAGKKIS